MVFTSYGNHPSSYLTLVGSFIIHSNVCPVIFEIFVFLLFNTSLFCFISFWFCLVGHLFNVYHIVCALTLWSSSPSLCLVFFTNFIIVLLKKQFFQLTSGVWCMYPLSFSRFVLFILSVDVCRCVWYKFDVFWFCFSFRTSFGQSSFCG